MKPAKRGQDVYGITTIGERGQVVIPADAREALRLKKGDKLVVFGKDGEMLGLIKVSSMEKFVQHLSENLEMVRKMSGEVSRTEI